MMAFGLLPHTITLIYIYFSNCCLKTPLIHDYLNRADDLVFLFESFLKRVLIFLRLISLAVMKETFFKYCSHHLIVFVACLL